MFRVPTRSFFSQKNGGRCFLASLAEEKPLIFRTTVGMPADGIAYNHYGIKYVLKRLGDQRRSKGSTHRGERRGREAVSTGRAHTQARGEIKGSEADTMRGRDHYIV